MRILIVNSCNAVSNSLQYTFIKDQTDALLALGVIIDFFGIKGKGTIGYLSNYKTLIHKVKEYKPDIIHAHYGLSGALAVLQRKVPVVITFHNGETMTRKGNVISSLASLISAYNIYVAQHIYTSCYLKRKDRLAILPCGVDLDNIHLLSYEQAKKQMNLPNNKVNILFGGGFVNDRKNVNLANDAIALLNRPDINLVELKGFSREQVYTLLCGCDLMLLTSISEGSPQIVKEAMACNCPVVATDVADIKELLGDTKGCYLTTFEPSDVAEKINRALLFGVRTNGREHVIKLNLDNKSIANQIFEIYTEVHNSTRN